MLSLDPLTNELKVRTESIKASVSKEANTAAFKIRTCHGVALLGHLAVSLDKGRMTLSAAAGSDSSEMSCENQASTLSLTSHLE